MDAVFNAVPAAVLPGVGREDDGVIGEAGHRNCDLFQRLGRMEVERAEQTLAVEGEDLIRLMDVAEVSHLLTEQLDALGQGG